MFKMVSGGRTGRTTHTAFGALVLAAVIACLACASGARADAFGQLAAFGQADGTELLGPGPIALDPGTSATDPTDDGIFVTDLGDGSQARLSKYSTTGTVLGSVVVPTADAPGGAHIAAIAVDAGEHRVYVLVVSSGVDAANSGDTDAFKIRAYNTTPNGSHALVAATGTGITAGVLVDFSSASTFVVDPTGLGVDPTTHKVVVLGRRTGIENNGHPLLQYVSDAGVASTPVDVLASETALVALSAGYEPPGLAVGPDGGVYIPVQVAGEAVKIYRVPAGGSGAATVVATDPASNSPYVPIGSDQSLGYGGPIAISPDGATVYLTEQTAIRGFSTANGKASVRYGLGDTTCNLDPIAQRGLAAGAGGTLVVSMLGQSLQPTPGKGILVFGPGGSGCPHPSASFTVNTSSDPTVTVRKGDAVALDASGSDLLGADPSTVAYDLNGDGTFETATPGAALTFTTTFLKTGTFDVALKISLGSDDPPVVHKTIKVVAPAPTAAFTVSNRAPAAGENVTFDAGGSTDPTGSPTGTPTHTLARYHWEFGDGAVQDTTVPTVGHAFANAGTAAVARTVKLTVTSADAGSSAPVSQTVTIAGTPIPAPPGPPSTPGPKPTPSPTPTPTPNTTVPTPAVSGGSVDAKGVVRLSIRCPAGGASCQGKVMLTVKTTKKVKGKKKTVTVTIGTASFTVVAGKSAAVKVKLSSAGKALLRKSKKLKTSAAFTLSAGGATAKSTKTLTLTAPKAKKSHG